MCWVEINPSSQLTVQMLSQNGAMLSFHHIMAMLFIQGSATFQAFNCGKFPYHPTLAMEMHGTGATVEVYAQAAHPDIGGGE